MPLVPRLRALLRLLSHAAAAMRLPPSVCLPRGLCTATPTNAIATPTDARSTDITTPAPPENASLLASLARLGVDLNLARRCQPGVLRKAGGTNAAGLARFLESKGASHAAVARIISRFPRAITRSDTHLQRRWALWRSVFPSDAQVVAVLDRSPESFFRSSDNDNLEQNLAYLGSLGLGVRDLHRLLTTAPRTFSNRLELNQQMVALLGEVGVGLGHPDPRDFARAVISRNLYVLIRSTRRVEANVSFLQAELRLGDPALLDFLQGPGAEVLDLSSETLKRNFRTLQEKLASLGVGGAQLRRLLVGSPALLRAGVDTLSRKLDVLLRGGASLQQILDKPKVLEYSSTNLAARLQALGTVRYDLGQRGITILDSSRKRFDAKLERLALSDPDP